MTRGATPARTRARPASRRANTCGGISAAALLDLGERRAQVVELLGSRTIEEVEQGRPTVARVPEGGPHGLGGERLPRAGWRVAPRPSVALAGDEALLGQTVEHGHHGRVGEV